MIWREDNKRWNNQRFEKLYNRKKKDITEILKKRGIQCDTLDFHHIQYCEQCKTENDSLLIYYHGVLNGISYVDDMMTPVTLDPLEDPEYRFEVIPLYYIKNEKGILDVSSNLNEFYQKYPQNEIILGWGVSDKMKAIQNFQNIHPLKSEADAERLQMIKNAY